MAITEHLASPVTPVYCFPLKGTEIFLEKWLIPYLEQEIDIIILKYSGCKVRKLIKVNGVVSGLP